MTDEELALLEALNKPVVSEGVTLIIKVNAETEEVESVEDLE